MIHLNLMSPLGWRGRQICSCCFNAPESHAWKSQLLAGSRTMHWPLKLSIQICGNKPESLMTVTFRRLSVLPSTHLRKLRPAIGKPEFTSWSPTMCKAFQDALAALSSICLASVTLFKCIKLGAYQCVQNHWWPHSASSELWSRLCFRGCSAWQ